MERIPETGQSGRESARELTRYSVTVDYVTTTSIVVDARDEEQAGELVEEYIRTPDGQNSLLRLMQRNVPDGLTVELVEKAPENAGAPLLSAEKPKLTPEHVDMWENHDDERRCPFCGKFSDYERREEDDGYDGDGHWIAFLFECNNCGGKWWASYHLTNAKVEEADR